MTVWLERSLDCGFSASRTIGFKFMSLMPYLFSAHFSAETSVIGSNPISPAPQQNVLRIGHKNVASFQGMRSIDGRVAWQGIANSSRLGRRVMGPAQKRLCRGRQIQWGFAEGVLNGLLRCFRVFRRRGGLGQPVTTACSAPTSGSRYFHANTTAPGSSACFMPRKMRRITLYGQSLSRIGYAHHVAHARYIFCQYVRSLRPVT